MHVAKVRTASLVHGKLAPCSTHVIDICPEALRRICQRINQDHLRPDMLSSVCFRLDMLQSALDMLQIAVVKAVSKQCLQSVSHLQQAAETKQANIEGYNQQQIADRVLSAGANHQGVSSGHKPRSGS